MDNRLVFAPMPSWFSLEISSHCNLKCPFCPTGNGTIPMAGRRNMDKAVFDVIFERIKPYAQVVQLYNWGEPFMHKGLYDFIERFTAAGIETQISSNLSVRTFDEEELEQLVRSGLTSILASIDGVTQEVYEIYRRNGKVSRALTNLRNIEATKMRLGAQTPHMIWGFYVNRHNDHQIPAARRMAKEIGVDLWFKDLSCPEDFQTPLLKSYPDLFKAPEGVHHSWRGRRNAALPPFELSRELPQTCGVCRIPFEMMVIDVDGDVSPCTVAMRKEMVVGSLLTDSLADIWLLRMARNRKQLLDLTTRQEGSQCLGCKHFPKAALVPA